MPVSLLTQNIQAARAAGCSITFEDQFHSMTAGGHNMCFAEAEIGNRLERGSVHAKSSPMANSRRFPPGDILTLESLPPGLGSDATGNRFVRTNGLGRDLCPTRAEDLARFNPNVSIWQGPFPAKEEEDEGNPNRFYTRPLMRKDVPITMLQQWEHRNREREFAAKATALDEQIEALERPQIRYQEHDAWMFAKEADVWELGENHEWVRRDYQAEERLRLEKEEYDRETRRLKRELEEWEGEIKRGEMKKAAEEADRAWENEVIESQDDIDALEYAFLGKQDRRQTKGERGGKRLSQSSKPSKPSKQGRVRVYHGAAKGICKGIRACG
ncbi:hypothetical protein PMIN06_012166 [Paraphaeosphaeria minitans]|uniref:Uncharacterized protein n=1 Tax=Paraphaeosphaeria minitans TaxID=565426 RepID=A0A9P6KWF4_9PLEO|nr:hypothetical protein PMIN01_00428 [Paraphaeosphaeria minitans]